MSGTTGEAKEATPADAADGAITNNILTQLKSMKEFVSAARDENVSLNKKLLESSEREKQAEKRGMEKQESISVAKSLAKELETEKMNEMEEFKPFLESVAKIDTVGEIPDKSSIQMVSMAVSMKRKFSAQATEAAGTKSIKTNAGTSTKIDQLSNKIQNADSTISTKATPTPANTASSTSTTADGKSIKTRVDFEKEADKYLSMLDTLENVVSQQAYRKQDLKSEFVITSGITSEK